MKWFIKTAPLALSWMYLFSPDLALGSESNSNPAPGHAYVQWEHGLPQEPGFFPIAVWLQSPGNARAYRKAGFNTYVGLWKGPTEAQLAELKKAGMKVICHQNDVGLRHINDPTIAGWMHGDEPDNAQSLGKGKGYGPPILPTRIVQDYTGIRARDPSRPVLLNLGQGVAWDEWHGRGVRTNHPEDYPEYVEGCDIASFDIYPVVHANPAVSGKLWYLARGVKRLREWTSGTKIVWNCIECTRINNPTTKPTPQQVRSEVWMSLIHESMGLIYFVHEWKPTFSEAALLSDPEMLQAVTDINRQVTALAPVLNSPTIQAGATASSDNPDLPVSIMVKQHRDTSYLFTVGMRDGRGTATFTLPGLTGRRVVEVLGENRTLWSQDGVFEDGFESYGVHLYKVGPGASDHPGNRVSLP